MIKQSTLWTPPFFSRRDMLLASAAAVVLARARIAFATTTSPAIDPDVPRRFIDAHCHVFNAHDIPMRQFIIETAVRESPDMKPWVGIASLLSWLIRLWVGITDSEVSLVDYPQAKPIETDEAKDYRDFHALVGDSVTRVASEAAGGLAAQRAMDIDPFNQRIMQYAMQRSPEMFQAETRAGVLPLNLSAVSMNYLLAHYSLEGLKHADSGARLEELRDADISGTVSLRAEDASLRDLTESLVADAHAQTTDVGSIMNLARIISRSRQRNIEVLDQSLGVAGASPPITRLYMPAMVDFDCWYGDSTLSLPMWKQTSIMSKLSKRQKDPNRFANGYVPLDPLRAVLVEAGVVDDFSHPLDVVIEAIENQGFVGAKLYPPMGFRPWSNSELKNEDFGPNVQPWIKKLSEKANDPNYQLGPNLDAQLMKLYGYCLNNDVSIMAHCSNSQTSFTGSGERASPEFWVRLFDQTDPASGKSLSQLRLSLGHFGSIWCHEYKDEPSGNPDSETERCHIAYGWPDMIVRAVSPDAQGVVRYPNLYFDLGDLGSITKGPNAGDWLVSLLKDRTPAERQAILSRMIYGTDWMFLVLYGKNHVNYINDIHNLLKGMPDGPNKIFHENAARFMGLTQDGRTAQRLRKFYSDNPDRLAGFESLLV
jgi:hypothetical protein